MNDATMIRTTKWQPNRFLKASAVFHAVAIASALLWPQTLAFYIAALVANHVVLTLAGLWPKSTLLGPNTLRLPSGRREIALTIDDGPDPEITPQVLDVLHALGVKATFFCIAEKVKNHPELVRRMIEEGHQIENHSMVHRHYFSVLGLNGIKKELAAAQQVIEEATGRKPLFFRAPAGLRNPFLDPVLHRLDLQLVSWTRRGFDTRVGDAQKVTQRLLQNAGAGDILLLHDGNSARSSSGRPVILDVLPPLVAAYAKQNLQFVTLEEGMRI